MKKILVCEDEDYIREFIELSLAQHDYSVIGVKNGEKAVNEFENSVIGGCPFSIVILDIMLPGMNGNRVCKILRARSAVVGIIMLTAKSQEADKVNSLAIGADDHISKPFSVIELVARVDALYRKTSLSQPKEIIISDIINSGPFAIDSHKHIITKNGAPLELTQIEYHIMEFFIKSGGAALDRKHILKNIWGADYHGDDKVVDVNIRRLRVKVENDPSEPEYILTVWGSGYRYNEKSY